MKSLILAIVLLASEAYSQTNTVRGGSIKEGYVITITNLSGDVLKDIKIVKIGDSAVTYMFYGSITRGGTIKYKEMSEKDRLQFGYDADRAAAAEHKETISKIGDGIKRSSDADEVLRVNRININRQDLINTKLTGTMFIFQKVSEGMLVRRSQYDDMIFLTDCPNDSQFADGEAISVSAYHMGLYKYSTVNNSDKTVQRYTCDLSKALNFRLYGN